MRPFAILLVVLGLLAAPGRGYGQDRDAGRAGLRARVVAEATRLLDLHIREPWGKNRGPLLDALIREAGGQLGDAWCSWSVVVELRRAGVPVPRFGRAKDWFDAVHTIWRAGRQLPGRPAPQPGDLLGYTWGHDSICHVELLVVWGSGPSCRAIGGNTGGHGALQREGEGMYQNWRLKRLVAAVANVIDNPHYSRSR